LGVFLWKIIRNDAGNRDGDVRNCDEEVWSSNEEFWRQGKTGFLGMKKAFYTG
jgi:hypothetical protein